MLLEVKLPTGQISLPNRFMRISGTAFAESGAPVLVNLTINGNEQHAVWGLPNMDAFDGSDASYMSGFTKLVDLGPDAFNAPVQITISAEAEGETLTRETTFTVLRDPKAPHVDNYAAGTLPDFRAFGDAFLKLMQKEGLEPDHHAVEIGPGAGRLSVAIARYLTKGALTAFDVDKSAVEFCDKNITGRYPSARFNYVDVRNRIYSPQGATTPEDGAIELANDTQDRAFCWSVFTHLVEADFRLYLREFARVVKPGGKAVFSVFVYDEGHMNRPFYELGNGFWTSNLEKPEAAIAVDADVIDALVLEAGFKTTRTSRINDPSMLPILGQDVVIAER